MCRLFGFRSVIQSQVHSSLVSADNALVSQSDAHPDGWGVAYYNSDVPHIIKSSNSAIDCNIFQKISGVVSSNTVLAHIRKATLGEKNILNTHPFQYGRWVFAHNGNIKDFHKYKDHLKSLISSKFKSFILGSTDSEIIFYFLLTHLDKKIDLENNDTQESLDLFVETLRNAINSLIKETTPYSTRDDAGDKETYFTFLLSNGSKMIGHHGGKNLYYSTYKTKCGDRDHCSSFSPECEAISQTGKINHLLFSSEPLNGENVWIALRPGEIIGADAQMKFKIYTP